MFSPDYLVEAPSREEIDAVAGATVIEFGTAWCGYCRAAQPMLAAALGERAEIRHLKIEDGPGRRLGRSFRIKLWPTLVFMRDGQEVVRLVRPTDASSVEDALAQVSAAP